MAPDARDTHLDDLLGDSTAPGRRSPNSLTGFPLV
jgi:hypothetical protein